MNPTQQLMGSRGRSSPADTKYPRVRDAFLSGYLVFRSVLLDTFFTVLALMVKWLRYLPSKFQDASRGSEFDSRWEHRHLENFRDHFFFYFFS